MYSRFPKKIEEFKLKPKSFSVDTILSIVQKIIKLAINSIARPGILLSGGIDSSLLALEAKKIMPDIPCFTIGKSVDHPDVVTAMKLAKERNLDLHVYLPSEYSVVYAQKKVESSLIGDASVYLALEFASKYCTGLLAGDGIDEQMGGYWGHRSGEFGDTENAFKHFWDQLESHHLTPMWKSAQNVGVDVAWVYLHPVMVNYIARIPLNKRICNNIGKAVLRDVARLAHVPEWIINRPKAGFCDALN